MLVSNNAFSSQSMDFLLSFNRCGTHYFCYLIATLTERPLKAPDGRAMFPHAGLSFQPNKKPFYHTHVPETIKTSNKINRLIVLVRDPAEIFIRSFGYENAIKLLRILAYNDPYDPQEQIIYPTAPYHKGKPIDWALASIRQFKTTFETYENFKNPKMLIWYEDLIMHPGQLLPQILDFLHEDHVRLNYVLNNLEHLQEQCRKAYVEQFTGVDPKLSSKSDRKTTNYHQRQASEEEVEELRKVIRDFLGPQLSKYVNYGKKKSALS